MMPLRVAEMKNDFVRQVVRRVNRQLKRDGVPPMTRDERAIFVAGFLEGWASYLLAVQAAREAVAEERPVAVEVN